MRRRFPALIALALGFAALTGPLAILLGAERGEAAFGDSEAVGVNALSSASVVLGLEPTTVPITALLLAPGDRVTNSIELRNDGSLPLRYSVRAERPGPSTVLLEALDWEIWMSGSDEACVRQPIQPLLFAGSIDSESIIGNPAVGQDEGDLLLEPGEINVLCFAAVLPLTTSNDLQDDQAFIDFVFLAEQAVGDS